MSTPDLTIRPARPDDLPAAARIYVLAEDDLLLRQFGRPSRLDSPEAARDEAAALEDLTLLRAEDPARVLVAVAGEEVLGVAACWVRERWWFLAYLFVRPDAQGQGIGRRLIERCHALGIEADCTTYSLFASEDPRAVSRYLRLGLALQPPFLDLRAEPAALTLPPATWDDGLEAHPLHPDDAARLNTVGDLDRAVRGARRAADLRRWLGGGASGALLTRRDTGAPAGYYLLDAPAGERTARLGPVVALELARVPTVLARALAAMAPLTRPDLAWRVTLPGQNQTAVAPLLAAGFRPRAVSVYLASAPLGQWDRYLAHDEDFL